MGILGTRWKPIIIYTLRDRKARFGQLDALIVDIMLMLTPPLDILTPLSRLSSVQLMT
ncbi:winged helix-turn-helix transcriptional regulator [Sphingobacterium sp. UBA7249]